MPGFGSRVRGDFWLVAFYSTSTACSILSNHERKRIGQIIPSHAIFQSLSLPPQRNFGKLQHIKPGTKTACNRFEWRNANDVDMSGLDNAESLGLPTFDAFIVLAVQTLQLPRRNHHTVVKVVEDISQIDPLVLRISRLFSESASANTYLALHHAPLHTLLAISGDTWVFNKKLVDPVSFAEHQKTPGSLAIICFFSRCSSFCRTGPQPLFQPETRRSTCI